MDPIKIDAHTLMHWMNARKMTPAMIAEFSDVSSVQLAELLSGANIRAERETLSRLAATLNIPEGTLLAADYSPAVIYRSRGELEATRRGLQRDGIHFYDYYTMPSPVGEIAPVIIQILCPSARLPALNNGHLEPAITINLGPGGINGRFAAELTPETWHPLRANSGAEANWIIGDSYVEPPYCPHTYSLLDDDRPARILSYTVKANLGGLVGRTNRWSAGAFSRLVARFDTRSTIGAILVSHMERRGHDIDSLARVAGIGRNALHAFTEGDRDALDLEQLRILALALHVDYRILLPSAADHDRVGKTVRSVAESIATIRTFKSYTVAEAAMSVNYPDMIGLFMKVDKAANDDALDIEEHSSTHYLVSGGTPIVRWSENGTIRTLPLAQWDSLWVSSHVAHGFFGAGSLIKMGNGEGIGYLDQLELSNTFNIAETLQRSRRDLMGWGYDA